MDWKDVVLTISGIIFSAAIPTVVWAIMKLRNQAASIRAKDSDTAAKSHQDAQALSRERRRESLDDAFLLIDKLQGQIVQLQNNQNVIRDEYQGLVDVANEREREARDKVTECESRFAQIVGWAKAVQGILRQKKIPVPDFPETGSPGSAPHPPLPKNPGGGQ